MFVLGIAGGTGSGKTTVAERLLAALGRHAIVLIDHDAYYRDRSSLPAGERLRLNYDHPDAIETELLGRAPRGLTRRSAPPRSRSMTSGSTCAAPKPGGSNPPRW